MTLVMRGGPGSEGDNITDEDLEGFRLNLRELYSITESREEKAIVRELIGISDAAVYALLSYGVYDRGLDVFQIRELLVRSDLMTKTERDAKRVRGMAAKTIAARTHVVDILGGFDGSMSVRQVFYQLVSRGAVKNTPAAYESVSRLLVDMRRDGSIDYHRIVDRTRRVHKKPGWAGVRQAMQALAAQYRRDPWDDQPVHVHIACEKQALEGVFSEVVDVYGAPLYTLRGFASEAFVFEWATEIRRVIDAGHRVVVAYFGDHDPSGIAIETDCQSRLVGHIGKGAPFEWYRAGLLFADLDAFELIPIPVKHGDSRARAYLAEHGDRAAELDALPPDVLRDRILESITSRVDTSAWDRIESVQRVETESLEAVAGNFAAALAGTRSAA